MPKVVSNTTPIISLLILARLNILKALYSEIYIPRAVFEEIEAGKNTPYYVNLIGVDWVRIMDALDELKSKGVWLSDNLMSNALSIAGEIDNKRIMK